LSITATIIGALLLAATAMAPGAFAGTADHPLVGAWTVDTDVANPSNPFSTLVFHADGTYLQVDVEGVGAGSWEASGPQTANLTAILRQPEGRVAVRAAITVAEDGDTFAASYTLEFIGGDPAQEISTGQQGPGFAEGTRIAVEAPGQPVGPITGPEIPDGASPDASASPSA
jgi:hypothetical protein